MAFKKADSICTQKEGTENFLYHTSPGGKSSKEEQFVENIVLLRKFLGNDLSFLFILDHTKYEVTAYFSLIDETAWRKMRWGVNKTICHLFSGPSPQWNKRLNKLLHSMLNKGPFASILVHPISALPEYTALLGMASLARRNYGQDHTMLLDLISQNISFCWENKDLARSSSRLEKEMDALNRFSRYLSSLDSDMEVALEKILPPYPKNGLRRCRLIAPMTMGDSVLGYVSILEDVQHKLGEMESLAIEYAVTVFTLKMMQGRIDDDVDKWIRGDFLDDLICGNYTSPTDIMQRASYLGYNLTEPHQVMFIEIDNNLNQQKYKGNEHGLSLLKRRVFEVVHKCLEEKIPSSILGTKSEAIVAVLPLCQQGRSLVRETAEYVKERVRQLEPDITVSIGIGRAGSNIDDIKVSYQEARRAVLIANEFGRKDQVTSYDSLGAYNILFNVRNMEELQKFSDQTLGLLLKYDQEKNNDILISTLKTYLACSCNYQKTADHLNVHLNTLKYRLQKIQDLANTDLSNPEVRLNFQLALKILEIRNLNELAPG
ncbi:MAG: helix-turn-helix domain-containing protein [Bacillota bacterium]